jgi:predicted transcriptional regulator
MKGHSPTIKGATRLVNLRLPLDTWNELNALAEREDRSVSQVMRRAIVRFLETQRQTEGGGA